MSKFCQKCGRPIADGMRFCEGCGTPVPAGAPQQPVYQQPAQPVYQQPAQPVYQQPAQPVYQQPAQPVYQQPAQPVYQQPAQPAYRPAPATAPVRPAAAPAKPAKSNDGMNKIVDKAKTFINGFINRCKSDKKVLIITCAAAVAVIALIVIGIVALIGNPQAKAVKKAIMLSSGKGRASQIKSMAPADYWDYVESNDGYDTDFADIKDEYADWAEDELDDLEDDLGEKVKIKFEHKNTVKVSKSDLNDIAEALDKQYGVDEDDVKEAKRIQGILYMEGNDKEDGWSASVVDTHVVRIGLKWYVVNVYEYGDNLYASFVIDSLVDDLAERAND